jgi:hypothetical protein
MIMPYTLEIPRNEYRFLDPILQLDPIFNPIDPIFNTSDPNLCWGWYLHQVPLSEWYTAEVKVIVDYRCAIPFQLIYDDGEFNPMFSYNQITDRPVRWGQW